MSVLIDSYSESNYSSTTYPLGTSGVGWAGIGQSITGTGKDVDYIQFYLIKNGSPTGSLYAKIYAHSGTFGTNSLPTGSAIAVSDAVNIADLGGSLALVTFTFSGDNIINLNNGTYYFIDIEGSYSFCDSGNRPSIGYDDTSPTHGGNFASKFTTTWSANSAKDVCFYIYGNDPVPSSSVSPSQSPSGSGSSSASKSLSSSSSESASQSRSLSPSSSASQSPSHSLSQSPSSSVSASESKSASVSESKSASPSSSESASPSPSGSQSQSPLPPEFVIKVAKSGIDALTATNPNDFIFHSKYNTLQIIKEGNETISYTADGRYAIAHGVSSYESTAYVLFCEFPDGYIVNIMGTSYIRSRDKNWEIDDCYIDSTEINFYLKRLGGSATSLSFKYYIFETPL